jgi:phytoene/squalene synthetase
MLRAMAVDHYENFPVASRLVPARLRGAVTAIYRFARAADDLADEGDAPAPVRRAALQRFAAHLDAIERGESPQEPPFPALAAAIRRHALPLRPFHDLLDAFTQDVDTPRYATYAALLGLLPPLRQSRGRLVLALYRCGHAAQRRAERRDLHRAAARQLLAGRRDRLAKGRVYLPQEDLARHGVDEAWIAEGRATRAGAT